MTMMFISQLRPATVEQILSEAPLTGIAVTRRSFPTARRHTHETLSLTVLTSQFTPSQRLHSGLNSTTFYTNYGIFVDSQSQ